ncbi:cryptochrome/photolyase family protein [Tatlockia sp. PL877]|nr:MULTISPECIES: cryptochrome/photolyase family protein [unclassified Legionella]MDI9819840.1 cryptochrome/photolyase family protein [Legionella sp. PL877]
MTTLCFILGDQLNETIASLAEINKKEDIVFLCEVEEETDYAPHHPKKIAFLIKPNN